MEQKGKITSVAIGIQQRLQSTRLPFKATKDIGGKTVTEHVIEAVRSSATYLNRHTHRTGIKCDVYLLVPEDDYYEIKHRIRIPYSCKVLYGPEDDVLSRYATMVSKYKPDYIARVTGDCPLLPSAVLTKLITVALKNEYDFFTNASPEFRTFYDGSDCEIVSRKLFDWINENAKGDDREHVMSLAYKERPQWATMGHLFSNMDLTSLKLSLDTEEDLKEIRDQYESVNNKINKWIKEHGRKNLHRF